MMDNTHALHARDRRACDMALLAFLLSGFDSRASPRTRVLHNTPTELQAGAIGNLRASWGLMVRGARRRVVATRDGPPYDFRPRPDFPANECSRAVKFQSGWLLAAPMQIHPRLDAFAMRIRAPVRGLLRRQRVVYAPFLRAAAPTSRVRGHVRQKRKLRLCRW